HRDRSHPAHSCGARKHAERQRERERGDRDRRDRAGALEVAPHGTRRAETPRPIRSADIAAHSAKRIAADPAISHSVTVKSPVASRTPPSASGPIALIVYPTPSIRPATAPTSAGARPMSTGSVITSGNIAPTQRPVVTAHTHAPPS